MLTYKLEEELKFAKYYANKLNDKTVATILETGGVSNSNEARHLSQFFWRMVNEAIQDEKKEVELPWTESNQFLTEKLLQSISGYLERAGYENEWDEVSDQENE